jgi:alpha/beta superfamily hydrolase
MREKIIHFPVERIELEGLLHAADGDKGVVISHPHPLFGGDMRNVVVEAVSRAYRQAGYTTLRFNFRGVGGSGGDYGGGVGERADVEAALQYLWDKGKTALDLAGYSFGAWVNGHSRWAGALRRMIMISPPVGFPEFREIPALPALRLVVTGGSDPLAPAVLLETLVPQWNPAARLEVIEGGDHFYGGALDRLQTKLAVCL